MRPALDWLDMTQPPPPRAHHDAPDSRTSQSTALTGVELACFALCLFALLYMAELLASAAFI